MSRPTTPKSTSALKPLHVPLLLTNSSFKLKFLGVLSYGHAQTIVRALDLHEPADDKG